MQAIGDRIIIPYWKKLMPKSISFEGALVATVNNDDREKLVQQRTGPPTALLVVMVLGQKSVNAQDGS